MNPRILSDLERAQLASPGTPDAELVIRLAKDTLDELGLQPAINHEIVASYRDVIRIEEADIPWSGHISQTQEGLVITVRASHPRTRKRFTVFHEILHTYMRGFGIQTQYRCHPGAPSDTLGPRDRALEQLCDLGAAELLLPRAPFLDDLAGKPVTLDLVEQLAEHYDASLEATARRVVAVHLQPTLLLALEPACKPSQPRAEHVLRVKWHYAGGEWPFVPRHKSVPHDGVFGRALQGEHVNETASLGDLTNPPIPRAFVSAALYPYHDDNGVNHMRVLALVTHINPPLSRHAH
jgi:hypothetical protein